MTAQDAQNHIEDIKAEISWLLFHKTTLTRKMELLKPKIESGIVKPLKTTNLSQITARDIERDVIPANMASMDVILAREQYYYAMTELANAQAAITAKTELLNSYIAHIKRESEKISKPVSDQMIFDAVHKVMAIKGLSQEEANAMTDINTNLLTYVNSGNQKRNEVLETLNNIIKSHE